MNCEKIWNCEKCENEFGNGRDFCRGCGFDLNVWNENEDDEEDNIEDLSMEELCEYVKNMDGSDVSEGWTRDEIITMIKKMNENEEENKQMVCDCCFCFDDDGVYVGRSCGCKSIGLRPYQKKDEEEDEYDEDKDKHCCVACENTETEFFEMDWICKECLEAEDIAKLQRALQRRVEEIGGLLKELIDPKYGGVSMSNLKYLDEMVAELGFTTCDEFEDIDENKAIRNRLYKLEEKYK